MHDERLHVGVCIQLEKKIGDRPQDTRDQWTWENIYYSVLIQLNSMSMCMTNKYQMYCLHIRLKAAFGVCFLIAKNKKNIAANYRILSSWTFIQIVDVCMCRSTSAPHHCANQNLTPEDIPNHIGKWYDIDCTVATYVRKRYRRCLIAHTHTFTYAIKKNK